MSHPVYEGGVESLKNIEQKENEYKDLKIFSVNVLIYKVHEKIMADDKLPPPPLEMEGIPMF